MYARAQDILDFWFAPPTTPEFGKTRAVWFKKDPDFDAALREQFLKDVEAALAGQLEAWAETPLGLLALVILLDQFPRNLFRGHAKSFAGDARALALAHKAVNEGWDAEYLPVQRWFLYLPFEHSEQLADQELSLKLFKRLETYPECSGAFEWADKHYRVVARFGRYPHRNLLLGRESTPEELEFLQQPGSSF